VSKHVQLRRILQEEIVQTGQVDDPLPSERLLMQTYNVGRSTAREAVEQLIKRGLAYRVAGKGTFIRATKPLELSDASFEPSGPDIRRRLGMLSFTNELTARGLVPEIRPLAVEMFINPAIADLLEVDAMTPLVMYSRLRLGDGEPMAIQTSYLRADMIGDNVMATLRKGPSLYEVLGQRGVVPVRAHEEYRCTTLDQAETCRILGARTGAPVFAVVRTTFDASGVKIEYATSILNHNMSTLEIEIT